MKLFSKSVAPSQTIIKNHGHIHDSNEDILRIIKLYNQGTMKTINEEPLPPIKYPILLKYRASNLYILITAAFSIFTSVYVNYSLSPITAYIIEHQIKINSAPNEVLPDEIVPYVLSSFHLFGLLGGLLLFGWLGSQFVQRKIFVIVGTLTALMASGAFMVSSEYWMLLPAKFLQGLSNACIWLMCSALIADIWPLRKLGSMVGLICGILSLGMTSGLTIGGVLFEKVDHRCSFFCALALCSTSFLMQLLMIERSTIPESWLEPQLQLQETELDGHNFKDMQRVKDVEGGLWSKSSSMSTINLRDQPVIFEKESDSNYIHGASSNKKVKNYAIFRLMTSFHLFALLYQVAVLSAVIGALEPSISARLLKNMDITSYLQRSAVMCSFLAPFIISAFVSGWFCDRFGAKIVGLASFILSIPAFIWIGVPNQEIQSVIAALSVAGIAIAGITVSVTLVATKILQKIIHETPANDNSTPLHLMSTSIIIGIISSTAGIGYYVGLFLSRLNKKIGFFWLCFILAMLLTTCIPLIVYYSKSYKRKSKSGLSHSNSKKSIVNNTRPASFAESIMSDDETTIGSASDDSVGCDMVIERKSSVIVIP